MSSPKAHALALRLRCQASDAAAGQKAPPDRVLLEYDMAPMTLPVQEELDRSRAASPRARSLPRGIYGAAALQRIDLIRSHTISPHRRKIAYEVLGSLTAFLPSCAASLLA